MGCTGALQPRVAKRNRRVHRVVQIMATYSCQTPKFMNSGRIDPSLAVAFYCHSREEFGDLRRRIEEVRVGQVTLAVALALLAFSPESHPRHRSSKAAGTSCRLTPKTRRLSM